ncbi:hypothetical protein [Sodalis sp. RH16]|uniref:hypothetical protein n=1 Tax=Sodalis sp. RH16 TaxID=3394331 RepID=UPI0039B5A7E2
MTQIMRGIVQRVNQALPSAPVKISPVKGQPAVVRGQIHSLQKLYRQAGLRALRQGRGTAQGEQSEAAVDNEDNVEYDMAPVGKKDVSAMLAFKKDQIANLAAFVKNKNGCNGNEAKREAKNQFEQSIKELLNDAVGRPLKTSSTIRIKHFSAPWFPPDK